LLVVVETNIAEVKNKMGDLMFRLSKGLIYGIYIGLIFGIGIYLVASAVFGMGWLTLAPVALASLIFSAGIMTGVSYEYSVWLSEQKEQSLLFSLSMGFIEGITLGLYISVAIYLIALAVAGMGFLVGVTPIQLASLVFSASIMASIGAAYSPWLDKKLLTKK
jgi:hypothetical protein